MQTHSQFKRAGAKANTQLLGARGAIKEGGFTLVSNITIFTYGFIQILEARGVLVYSEPLKAKVRAMYERFRASRASGRRR